MVLRKDYPYILLAVLLSVLAATAVVDPKESVGTFAFLGLIGIGVVMAIIINPALGANILLIAVFSNVSRQLTDYGLPGIIKPLVVVVLASIVVRSYYIGQLPLSRPKTSRIELALIAYFLAVSASLLVASDRDLALERIVDLGKDLAIIYCILFSLRRPQEWKNAVFLVLVVVSCLSLLGIYQLTTGNYSQTFFGFARVDTDNRSAGPINEPNMWGQVLVAVIPFAFFGVMRESFKNKFIYAGIFLVLFIGLLNTYSRGGYLAFILISLLTMFFFARFNMSLVFSVVLIVAVGLPFLPSRYVERFQTLFLLSPANQNSIYEDSSFRGRTSEVLTGFAMLADHPLLGVGAANYSINYQKYAQVIGIEVRSEDREAHSLYVEVMAETGIIGLASFIGIIFFLFRGLSNIRLQLRTINQIKEWSTYISAMQVALAGYLFAAFFLHGAYIRFFWMLVAITLVLIQIIHESINGQAHFKRMEKTS